MYPVRCDIVIRSSEDPVSEFDLAAVNGESGFEPIFFFASSSNLSCNSFSVCLIFFFSPFFLELFFLALFSESTSDLVSSVSAVVDFEFSFDFLRTKDLTDFLTVAVDPDLS